MAKTRVTAVALAALVSGCISTGSVQRAETLGRGNFEFGIEPGLWTGISTVTVSTGSSTSGNAPVYVPTVNFSGRFGLTDRFDLGFRFGSGLIELMTKVMFTSPESSFVLSLAPSAQGVFLGLGSVAAGYVNLAVPLLIGFKFGPHELTFGPRLNNLVAFGSAGGSGGLIYTLMPGLSVGFAARVGDVVELMPEVSFAVPVFGSAAATNGTSSSSASAGLGQAAIINVQLGVKFGKFKPRSGSPAPATDGAPPDDLPPPPPPPPAEGAPPPPPPPPPPV